MSAIIKIKPVHVCYLMGEDDINLNLLRVPQIYKLEKRSLTIVDKYLDHSYQWVLLTDGRRVRTREFKKNWKLYIPGAAERLAALDAWEKAGLNTVPTYKRQLASGWYDPVGDYWQGQWKNGMAVIRFKIKGVISVTKTPCDTPERYMEITRFADQIATVIDRYRRQKETRTPDKRVPILEIYREVFSL